MLNRIRLHWIRHLCSSLVVCLSLGSASAQSVDKWNNASHVLAVGLPMLAAGTAFKEGDAAGFQQLTLTMASAVGAAELLKRTIPAQRPDGSDNKSFPSGHTAVAFAAVRFMDKRYGEAIASYTPWLYAAAGLTGLARVEADKHYWHDAAAGALLGWGAANWWAEPIQGGQMTVLPSSKGVAVSWRRAW